MSYAKSVPPTFASSTYLEGIHESAVAAILIRTVAGSARQRYVQRIRGMLHIS